MALAFRVQQARITGGGFSSIAPRNIANQQAITFDVLAYDDSGGTVNPVYITEQHLLGLPELPILNRDMFGWSDSSKYQIVPWLICSRKTVERDRQQALLFRVTCEFSTGQRFSIDEDDLKLRDIPAGVGNYPFLREITWGEDTQVVYQEIYIGAQPKMLLLPTGNYYSEPFIQKFATKVMRQSQFENLTEANVHNTIRDRLFTVNGIEWDGDPAPDYNADIPPRWMITAIDYQPVNIWQPADPPDPANKLAQMLMTYTLTRNAGDGGWWDKRALVDTHYLKTANDLTTKTPYRDPSDKTTVIPAKIKKDGTLVGDQTGNFEYESYRLQNEANWSYLRT